MYKITTKYTSNSAGRGGIVVKGLHDQKTYSYDHASGDNHLAAAKKYTAWKYGTGYKLVEGKEVRNIHHFTIFKV
jgi:hypothetical protein